MGLKEDFYEMPPSKCLLAGFLLCVLYYFTLFDKGTNFSDEIQHVQNEINDKNARVESVQKALNDKDAFAARVKNLEKDFVEILKYFPVNMDMNDVQKDMTGLLNRSGIKVVSLKETTVQSRFPGYIENGLDLETASDFHQIMGFLADITAISKVVDFRSMEFVSDGSNDEVSKIKFKMQFSVFKQDPNFQKKPADPAAGAPGGAAAKPGGGK